MAKLHDGTKRCKCGTPIRPESKQCRRCNMRDVGLARARETRTIKVKEAA